ncbi:MAG: hypothetical protein WB586_29805 [Chthoniobacterales bacterium]
MNSEEFVSLDIDSQEFEQGVAALKEAIATHQVVEGNHVKPTLKGSWAVSSAKVTPGAPAKKILTPEEAQQLAEAQRRQVVETKAKELLNLINTCIYQRHICREYLRTIWS